MKILLLDIETAPNLAHVWRFFQENVGANQVMKHSTMLSYAAKWVGRDTVYYQDVEHQSEKNMLRSMNKLLNAADCIVAHNGNKFDMPKIRGRSMVHGLALPSPYKQIDTYLIAHREFGFDSNSLEYLAKVLKLPHQKEKHKKFPGHEMWVECLKGNPEAWAEMRKYNIQDIHVLEDLYLLVRPYARTHPNFGVFVESEKTMCPKCGSEDRKKDGFAYTMVGKFPKYECRGCGGYYRSRFSVYDKAKRRALAVNVAT